MYSVAPSENPDTCFSDGNAFDFCFKNVLPSDGTDKMEEKSLEVPMANPANNECC